jgi:receptor protein-tyrosine kinase
VVRIRRKRQAQNEHETGDLSERLVTVLDPTEVASEAYRTLRTRFMYARFGTPPKVVLITSPGRAEGKSTVCANLGVVLAEAGKETLIIDGDLRKPDLHEIFDVPNQLGYVNVLSDERILSEIWTEPLPRLKVATAGPIPPNPAELLSSARFAQLLDEARRLFDHVLIDSPPTESVSDPMIVAAQADAVMLVFNAQVTRKVSLRRAVHGLEAVGANVLGTVMNNVEGR